MAKVVRPTSSREIASWIFFSLGVSSEEVPRMRMIGRGEWAGDESPPCRSRSSPGLAYTRVALSIHQEKKLQALSPFSVAADSVKKP